jgi:hypothetical protein
MSSSASRIEYSEKYADDHNEYRYVQVVVSVDGGHGAVPVVLDALVLRSGCSSLYGANLTHSCFPDSPITQACDSSQGTRQDVAQEPPFDRIRVAWYWCAAKPWMATLRNSPVSHWKLYFLLFASCARTSDEILFFFL